MDLITLERIHTKILTSFLILKNYHFIKYVKKKKIHHRKVCKDRNHDYQEEEQMRANTEQSACKTVDQMGTQH